ncbi:hypothetical protein EHQ64_10280 [Leptospira sarikeiensis]|uniref:Uncharacterized protein n=1 Tax=Leptospira sarikeiensis TaxID=2484943 RepID=A0A4R9K786_9LEPT|nr:hypothetical protein EHQ64_10280 [Leptospira sarikeiensis]
MIFYAQGIEWNERRLYTAGAHGFRHWYSNHTKHLLLSLLSFFNGLLPLFFENLLQRRISFYLVFLGAILITFFTADATRVFANLFYPLWIGFWLLRANKGFSKNEKWILTSGLVLAFLYLLLLDPFYQWGGDIFFLKKGKL